METPPTTMLRWKLNEARLETRVRRGAFADSSAVSAVSVANFVRAFATLPWELGEKTWRAVDAAVAREGTLDAADARELSVVFRSLATAAWDPSEAAWRAIDRGVERSVASERGGRATPQAVVTRRSSPRRGGSRPR
jgi:hypothetical protein